MATVLNNKQKELIFRFHIKDATMTELANELGVAPKVAYDVYKQFVVDIIRDFKKSGYINITYGKSDTKAEAEPAPEPKMEPEIPEPEEEEPEEEPVKEEPVKEEPVKEEPVKEEPAKEEQPEVKLEAPGKTEEAKSEPVEEEIQPAPSEEVKEEPRIKIPTGIMQSLINEDRPIVLEKNEFAGQVAALLNEEGEVLELENPEELPEISIASREVLEKIGEPFVFVRPIYDADKNIIIIETDEIGDE